MEVIVAIIGAVALITSTVIQVRNGKKISETHKQVSVNSHSSEKPTVLDLISELRDEQRDTNRLLVNHLEWHLEEKNE